MSGFGPLKNLAKRPQFWGAIGAAVLISFGFTRLWPSLPLSFGEFLVVFLAAWGAIELLAWLWRLLRRGLSRGHP